MKLVYQYMPILLPPPPPVFIDSYSWLVVDEDDNGKFRLQMVNL